MLKQKLRTGAIVGCLVGLVGGLISTCRPDVFEGFEWKTYDTRARRAADPNRADPRIVMVDIDELDLAWYQREVAKGNFDWPWPRDSEPSPFHTTR